MEHHTADAGGTRLHYVTSGSGPAVLLLHGWPQTWYEWRRVAGELSDCTVVMPDLRGFGYSAKPASGYDARTMAADLHGLVSQLGLRDVTVVGHDWGAVFGYVYTATHPDEVRALGVVEMVLPGVGMMEQSSTMAHAAETGKAPRRDKRHAIADAALRVFLRRGFAGASIDEIAAEAHVSKPTIYAHFSSKEELFRRIMAAIVEHAQSGLTAFTPAPAHDATDVVRELHEYAHIWMRSILQPDLLAEHTGGLELAPR